MNLRFVLAEQWERSHHEFEASILQYRIDCRLSPIGLERLGSVIERGPARLALESADEPDEQGWTRLRLPAEQFGHATVEVMSLAPEIEVLGPPELVQWVLDTAARMAAMHGRSP